VVVTPVPRPRWLVGPRVRARDGVVWAVLLSALAVSLAPGLYMVSLSLMDNPQLFAGRLIPIPPHPSNYPRAWVASNIGRLYWNSIYVSTVSMVVTVAISALAGYGLGRIRFAGRSLVYGIVLVGLTIPLQIALIPLFINLRTLGLINTPFALIGPYTAFGLAFGTYVMTGFFRGLPRELEEAARLDGASEFQIFRKIVLPLMKPAIVVLGIFTFMFQWVNFLWPLVITTTDNMKTLTVGIASLQGQFVTDWGVISAAAVMTMGPVIVIFLIFQRWFVQASMAGALKQ